MHQQGSLQVLKVSLQKLGWGRGSKHSNLVSWRSKLVPIPCQLGIHARGRGQDICRQGPHWRHLQDITGQVLVVKQLAVVKMAAQENLPHCNAWGMATATTYLQIAKRTWSSALFWVYPDYVIAQDGLRMCLEMAVTRGHRQWFSDMSLMAKVYLIFCWHNSLLPHPNA